MGLGFGFGFGIRRDLARIDRAVAESKAESERHIAYQRELREEARDVARIAYDFGDPGLHMAALACMAEAEDNIAKAQEFTA